MGCCFLINNQKQKSLGSIAAMSCFHIWNQQAIIGVQREYQLAITDRDKRIEVIQYENVTPQGEIKNAK